MKNNELILELISAGCFMKRGGRNNHNIWYSPITKKSFPVPDHGAKEVPIGTEKSIRRLSGVHKNK